MNDESLFKYAEKKANIFNVYCLLVISFLGLIVEVLNEFGIFALDKTVARLTTIQLVFWGIIPYFIYLIHDKFLKKENSIFEKKYFKWILIVIIYLSVLDLTISFGFHAILIFAIPPLVTAQYKLNRSLSIISFIASIVLVILSIYGAYFIGQYDANLLKPLTKEEALIFENKINTFTPKRAFEILLHYCLPNIIALCAIDFIGFSIVKRNAEMLNIQIDLSNKVNEEIISKSKMQNGVIEHLADIIESRDIETGEHIKRTKEYVSILVNKMKDNDKYKDYLTPQMCEYIINAAPLHDIGKIAVSDLILCKPGKLTDEEFDKMKIHTVKGGEIIKNILNDLGNEEFLNVAYNMAISHHEKWNGKGYPYGQKEEDISLPGRIMAIADVFDALVAKRVYKEPMPIDKAINIIIQDSGTHFDPNIVEIFKTVIDDFKVTATMKM